jgi:hypothetical protein
MDNFDFVIENLEQQEQEKEFVFSNQVVGALMLALQNSLLNQTDIVPVLKEWKLKNTSDGLVVLNPPIVKTESEE